MNSSKAKNEKTHKSRAHWMRAVQDRPNSTGKCFWVSYHYLRFLLGRLTGARKFNANSSKTDPNTYFANILRKNIRMLPKNLFHFYKSYLFIAPSNSGTATLDVEVAQAEEVPFLSTSMFLREQFGYSTQLPPKKCQGTYFFQVVFFVRFSNVSSCSLL